MRLSVVNRAGLVYSMPISLVRRVRALPGVADATAMLWFGGAFEEEGQVTFPSFAVEADHIAGTYPDYAIPERVRAEFERNRDAALVGPSTLERYGWEPGDRITLSSDVWNVELDLRVVGEIPQEGSPLVWIHREYLAAGAEALTANTFRTQRRTLARAGLGERAPQLTALAVELAWRPRTGSSARRASSGCGRAAPPTWRR